MRRFIAITLVALLPLGACTSSEYAQEAVDPAAPAVSGRIQDGLRVLTVDPAAPADFTVFRGDYVRLEVADGSTVTFVSADLGAEKVFPVAEGDKPYFKVPNPGTFAYTIGEAGGSITALEYTRTGYQEVGAADAVALMKNLSPFVLDVRTPDEFASGHLEGAHLVPVQVLQKQIGSLPAAKDQPIFVYCRSGNRSTVAAKILMDFGYEKVINLRRGIREWQKLKLPTVK